MLIKQLLSGAILTVGIAATASADEGQRTFTRQSLTLADTTTTTDFPLAPEARTASVNELVALLDRVRESDRSDHVVVRTLTLEDVVRTRAWRQEVAHQLGRLFH